MSTGIIASHFVASAAGYAAAVAADAPDAWLRHGDAFGATVAADSSGNGHPGTYAGGVVLGATPLVTGDATTSADFTNGNSGIVGNAWMSSPTAMSFEAVIKPDTISGSYNFIAVRDDNNGTGNLWWLVIKGGKLTMLCRGSEFSGATTLLANTKYHVGCSYDGTTAKVLLNGSVDGSAARSGAMSTANSDLLIGRWGNGGSPLYFDGKIQESAYYKKDLTQPRFAAHAALI